jgi:hypothetical protein
VIGAVTTAWDTAHAVISTMGDRFVLVHIDSSRGRMVAGRRAIGNTGDESRMRNELAEAVAKVIATMTAPLKGIEILLAAADLVTFAHRSGIRLPRERDRRARTGDADSVRQAASPDCSRWYRYRHGPQCGATAGDPVCTGFHAAFPAGDHR